MDLSGPHRILTWYFFGTPARSYPPGSVLFLSHQDAVRAREQGTATPCARQEPDVRAAAEDRPTPTEPLESSEAKPEAAATDRAPNAPPAEEPAPFADPGSSRLSRSERRRLAHQTKPSDS